MKMNKIAFVVATFVVVIVITLTGGIGYNSNQDFQIIQSMNGKMSIQSKGGYYGKFFPTVWTYDKQRTIYYSKELDESKDNDALPVRFANKGTGDVSVQVIVRLFSDEPTMLLMHEYARGDIGIIENIIYAKLKEIAMSVASTMSSNDAIENYSKFNEGMRKQIVDNKELTERGIFIEQFSITAIDFDQQTIMQFKKQQEIELARKEAEANKIKFETELSTVKVQYEREQAESEGKAKVVMIKETTDAERQKQLAEIEAQKKVEVAKLEAMQAEIDANRQKEVAIIEATKLKETAKLNKEAAELDAQRVITLAQAKQKELELAKGLSEYDKFALNIQKEIEIQKAEKVANAIRGLQLPQTMIINGGGSNSTSNTNNPVMDLINVLMVKEAKNLNK